MHKDCITVRGMKFFKCLKCGKDSNNYCNGVNFCYECCIKLNICRICGKKLKDEAE